MTVILFRTLQKYVSIRAAIVAEKGGTIRSWNGDFFAKEARKMKNKS